MSDCKGCGKIIISEKDTFVEEGVLMCSNCCLDVETGEIPKHLRDNALGKKLPRHSRNRKSI